MSVVQRDVAGRLPRMNLEALEQRRNSGVDLPTRSLFGGRVIAVVRRIPVGRVATYGDVAALAGRPRAARAVGNIMKNCHRRDVPCHRVIAAGGRLGGYGGSEALKRALLMAEGIGVSGGRVREIRRVRWTGR
jgi:O-6-methylguanine DNA methyltransferase